MISGGKDSKKVRQILLHWCYEIRLNKTIIILYVLYKMSYYKKNREVLLKKAYNKYHNEVGKEKAAKHYQKNKEEIKKKERNKYKNIPEDQKKCNKRKK